jgi:MoaA/NifB/PqqE/SkfB family radical SAM enzyme
LGEHLFAEPSHCGSPLQRLPLVTLYLTERCNSRCVTCDYWRNGRVDMTLERLTRMLPSLRRLETRVAMLSGGEPLLNLAWAEMAQALRDNGQRVWLLTSGLALAKYAHRVAQLIDAVTVSLDGTNASTYAAIRGLDAFDKVCEGIRAAADAGSAVSVRVTVQRANYRELPLFVDVARRAGARQVSFLAVDVGNPHAFGRADDARPDVALHSEDLAVLADVLNVLEREHAHDFQSGFIAESPQKLRRLLQYFAAVNGTAAYPPVRCNAPEFSAVVGVSGRVQPCFFIPGPADSAAHPDLEGVLNSGSMSALRAEIGAQQRPECARCVCSMWRAPETFADADFLLPKRAAA